MSNEQVRCLMLRARRWCCGMVLATTPLLLLAGCGGKTNITCSDYLNLDDAEQIDVMAAWEKDHNTNFGGALGDIEARQDQQAMVEYCSKPEHSKDKLSDLTYSFEHGG